MTSTEIKNEYEIKYGKMITNYLANMTLEQTVRGDKHYLGDDPEYLIKLLLAANEYLLNKIK